MSRKMMTGSRGWTNEQLLYDALDMYVHEGDVLVHGACSSGADAYAANWARENNIQQEPHPADWSLGNYAGFLRNKEMANSGVDMCLAFLRGHSPGTLNAVNEAERAGVKTLIWSQE